MSDLHGLEMYHWAVHKLAQSVLAYGRKQQLLQAGDRVGIAVSGGADSVALLRLMVELRQEIGLVLSVVHLNHQLRGAESDGDEVFVHELAETHGLEFTSKRRNVKEYAAKKKVSVEAAARELRYEFFRKVLGTGVCSKIATAHTLDDQAETVLLKLARGAGTRGMAGIWPKVAISHQPSAIRMSGSGHSETASLVVGTASPSESQTGLPAPSALVADGPRPTTDLPRNAAIVRPLLAQRREDLREYLAYIGQTWREDSSNRDLRHTRNRIRHGILPRLERHANPRIRETFAETAEIARGEEEYWTCEIEKYLPHVWRDEALDLRKLGALPLAVRRRLVRAVAESVNLHLEFRHVEEIVGLTKRGRTSLPNGGVASRCGDLIRLDVCTGPRTDYAYLLPVPGQVQIREARLVLLAELVPDATEAKNLLDSRFAQSALIVRNWHSAERFWAPHTKDPKKIKELLQDRHITGDRKKLWPVIASGDEIVWMRGFGVRRDFAAKNGAGILISESKADPS